ncbi:MAG: ribonuclease HI [Sedimentisphaerales bacterium]|nr:ribonuclease HI [Sedimentisphaerales bacterium]
MKNYTCVTQKSHTLNTATYRKVTCIFILYLPFFVFHYNTKKFYEINCRWFVAENKDVIIYTDGGCDPNPGAGGYGVVLIYGKHRKELSGGFRLTTNNRMEMYAAIMALETLKEPCKVKLYSDSKYLVNAMTLGWIKRWENKGWSKVKNPDLWKKIAGQCKRHKVEFLWVKGHNGNPNNERCDVLALNASKAKNLQVDEIYENNSNIKEMEDFPIHDAQDTKPAAKYKIVEEGQPCRKCSTPVIKKTPRRKKLKPGQSYYFEYFFFCPNCKAMYMVEEAKRYYSENLKDGKQFEKVSAYNLGLERDNHR